MAITQFSCPKGTLYVELTTTEAAPPKAGQRAGVQPIAAGQTTYAALQALLDGLGALVHRQMAELSPDEVNLEAHIGFAGELSPIPFLASTKSDAALTLKLVWKKGGSLAGSKSP